VRIVIEFTKHAVERGFEREFIVQVVLNPDWVEERGETEWHSFKRVGIGVTQLDVGAAAKPPARAVLTPYKGCFRADYRPPLHKMTSTA